MATTVHNIIESWALPPIPRVKGDAASSELRSPEFPEGRNPGDGTRRVATGRSVATPDAPSRPV